MKKMALIIGLLIILLGTAQLFLATTFLLLSAKVNDQQRQIDQLCLVVPPVLQYGLPTEDRKDREIYDYDKLPAGKYFLWFANYKAGKALAVYNGRDSKGHYNGKTHYAYVYQIPEDILSNWGNGEMLKVPLSKD